VAAVVVEQPVAAAVVEQLVAAVVVEQPTAAVVAAPRKAASYKPSDRSPQDHCGERNSSARELHDSPAQVNFIACLKHDTACTAMDRQT
jgi:hypothetical protein